MIRTDSAQKLLDTLDTLPEAEQHKVYREVLRRAALSEHDSLDDEDLIAAADEVFLGLDHAERLK